MIISIFIKKLQSMKKILSLVFSVFCFYTLVAQKTEHIDLSSESGTSIESDYYVIDVYDERTTGDVIGMIVSADGKGVSKLEFQSDFTDELYTFFRHNYLANTDKAPVIVVVKKLWISESSTETEAYSLCDLEISFLTPQKQQFHEVKIHNELPMVGFIKTHQMNVVQSLQNAMLELNKPVVREQYNRTLSANIGPDSKAGLKSDKYIVADKYMHNDRKARIAFDLGFHNRFYTVEPGTDEEIAKYLKRLRRGLVAGIDLSIFSAEKDAIGLTANFGKSHSLLSNVVVMDNYGSILATGDLEENVTIYYFGPSYWNITPLSRGGSNFIFGVTLGYYGYHNKYSFLNEETIRNGGSFGLGFNLGTDFFISENIALGIKTGLLIGWANKLRENGEVIDLDRKENLTRVDITIGLRLYK